MKIGVASNGKWLESEVDYHTGRAHCFILYDTDTETFEVIDNWKCMECVHWAGLQSANALIEIGVEAAIVRNIGPNTFRALVDANIDIYYVGETTVVKAIRLLREGALERAEKSNCAGHPHLY